ncbi:MAG TPA: MBL fold metallo-hydrolase [Candidatus Woesebacteria bacterium]|nr:MBL fold metallo-hydrolase [Candidatus Woesebacteria bacterium]
MQIVYLGHSSFKLKGKNGSVVTDPFSQSSVGFSFPSTTTDIITVSHQHADHNAIGLLKPTSRRERPFLVTQPGEYEVGGISVFGVPTFHDDVAGALRGNNTVFTIFLEGIRLCHLGDLGHPLSTEQVEAIGSVDVLFCPVGGVFTLDPAAAVKTIRQLEPSIVIPMHYKTAKHEPSIFGELKTVEEFLHTYGVEVEPVTKLEITSLKLPEETEVVVLTPTALSEA